MWNITSPYPTEKRSYSQRVCENCGKTQHVHYMAVEQWPWAESLWSNGARQLETVVACPAIRVDALQLSRKLGTSSLIE